MLTSIFNADRFLDLHHGNIAEYCEETITLETLLQHLEQSVPFSRKEFCRYLGVAESTMTGWLKEDRVPLMAKEAFLLPIVRQVLREKVRQLKKDVLRPRILKNGDRYQICVFGDNPCGAVGSVIVDNLPNELLARNLVAGLDALDLLFQCRSIIRRCLHGCIGTEKFTDELQALYNEIWQVLFSSGLIKAGSSLDEVFKDIEVREGDVNEMDSEMDFDFPQESAEQA